MELHNPLHNHPFFILHLPDGDIAGTVIPSGTVQFGADLKEYDWMRTVFGMSEAWITNGFDSLILPTSDAPKLWPTERQ